MKYRSNDTVASLLAIPQTRAADLSAAPTTLVAARAGVYKANTAAVSPDLHALAFYSLNQCMAVIAKKYGLHGRIPDEVLPIAQAYVNELVSQTERLFIYTLLICTRESRHISGIDKVLPDVAKQFGQEVVDFNAMIRGSGSDGAVNYLLKAPPACPLGKYVDSLVYIFDKGKFGGGYGGKPWANIAQTLASTINGQTSLEIMADTAYTLAHNNGPMFNKGMLYKQYDHLLYKVLDVQRSGQCVELVNEGKVGQSVSSKEHCKKMVELFPEEFGQYVDWFKVRDLGALKEYPAEMAMQEQKYGKPIAPGMQHMKVVATVEIFPSHSVKLMERI